MPNWRDLRSILRGKNRASNLMILGVVLITLGASYQLALGLNMPSLIAAGNLLVLLGLMSFFVGFLKYVLEKN